MNSEQHVLKHIFSKETIMFIVLVIIGLVTGLSPSNKILNSLRPSDAYGSNNGLSPERRQAITYTNAGILSIGPLGTNFNEISIGIQTFSFKKMHFRMSSAKWRPFCLGLNVLMQCGHTPGQKGCNIAFSVQSGWIDIVMSQPKRYIIKSLIWFAIRSWLKLNSTECLNPKPCWYVY